MQSRRPGLQRHSMKRMDPGYFPSFCWGFGCDRKFRDDEGTKFGLFGDYPT